MPDDVFNAGTCCNEEQLRKRNAGLLTGETISTVSNHDGAHCRESPVITGVPVTDMRRSNHTLDVLALAAALECR